jgi:hypothetical protein
MDKNTAINAGSFSAIVLFLLIIAFTSPKQRPISLKKNTQGENMKVAKFER